MQNIVRLLQKYQIILLFLVLQMVCFFLIVLGNNKFHRASIMRSSNTVVGGIYDISNSITGYFRLQKENDQLVHENLVLQKKLMNYCTLIGDSSLLSNHSLPLRQYQLIAGKVISSTKTLRANSMTINIAGKEGIEKGMGVIGTKGIVGITVGNSSNYTQVLPIINENFELSVRHQKSKSFGLLKWLSSDNFQTATIEDIPISVAIKTGDVIETRGADGIFPESIAVGTVITISNVPGETFQLVKIRLLEDFGSVYNITVVKNAKQKELRKLENELPE